MSLFDLPGYLDLAVVSADRWSGTLRPYQATIRSNFSAKASATYQVLRRELDHLDAEDRTLYVAVAEEQFRRDGRPRVNATILAPGVVLEFQSKGQRFEYAADQFYTQHENLRAVALTLEHLRAVDRYGLTGNRQQYAGFLAIESATALPSWTFITAMRFIYEAADEHAADNPLSVKEIIRLAKRKTHPDTAGGDADTFQRVSLAEQYLKQNGHLS